MKRFLMVLLNICLLLQNISVPASAQSVDNEYFEYIKSYTDKVGNAFSWYEDDKIIYTSFKSNKDFKGEVIYRATDVVTGEELFNVSEQREFILGTEVTGKINIGEYNLCGKYNLYVTVLTEGYNEEFNTTQFVILKTDPDGIKNKDVYMSMGNSYSGTDEKVQDDIISVLNAANIGGIRDGVYWWMIEQKKDVLSMPEKVLSRIDKVKNAGMEYQAILSDMSMAYTGDWDRLPVTSEEKEAYARYIEFTAGELKDKVDSYEIWNEPNHKDFNKNYNNENGDGRAYADIFKIAYDKIKSADSDALVGGPGLAGDVYSGYLKDAVDAGMGNMADAVSLHPYIDTYPEVSGQSDKLEKIRDGFINAGNPDIKMWLSEIGYKTGEVTEWEKGAWTLRSFMYYDSKLPIDKFIIYTLAKTGNSTYGWTSPVNEADNEFDAVMIPEISYVMLAAMNYMLAESEFTESIEVEDKNIKFFRYKSNKFDNDVIAAYSVTGKKSLYIDAEGDVVTYFDNFGNEKTVQRTNGKFLIELNDAPLYIMDTGLDFLQEEKIYSETFNDLGNFEAFAGDGESRKNEYSENIRLEKTEYGKAMKLSGKAISQYHFEKAVLKDNLYVSFDVWSENDTLKGLKVGGYTDKNGNLNVRDYAMPGGSLSPEIFLNISDDNKGGHYDLIFDMESRTYNVYKDGNVVLENAVLPYGLKTVFFDYEGNGDIYIDNFFVKNYSKYKPESVRFKMSVNESMSEKKSTIFELAFSECVNAEAFKIEDFEVKNIKTGEIFNPDDIEKYNVNSVSLFFSDIKPGEYEVTYKGGCTGKVTGNKVKGTDSFFVTRSVNGRKYYVKNLLKDSTFEIKADDSFTVNLPQNVRGGRFSVKFDIQYNSDAVWDIGFYNDFHKDDWQGYTADFISDNGGSLNLEKRQEANKLIGISQDGTIRLQSNNARSIANWTSLNSGITVTKNGVPLKVPKDKWSSVKIEFDLDSSSVVVFVNGEKSDRIYGHDGMFYPLAIKRQKEDGTYEFKHCFGIEDLVFYAYSGNINIRDINVYKDSDMYEKSDFDYAPGSLVNTSRFGWFEPTLPVAKNFDADNNTGTGKEVVNAYGRRWINYSYLYNKDGVKYSDNSEDTALALRTNQYLTPVEAWRYFSEPVEAGKAFTVEFDIKCDAGTWGMNLLDEQDMQISAQNSTKTLTPDGIKTTIAPLSQRYNSNAVVTTYGGSGISFVKGYTPAHNPSQKTTGIEFKNGEWHHIKFDVLPAINKGAKYKIEVIYADGTKAYSEISDSERIYDKAIAGIGFVKMKSGDTAEYLSIDNLEVYSREKPELLAVKSVSYDGMETVIEDKNTEISTYSEKIKIIFSKEIIDEAISEKIVLKDRSNNKINSSIKVIQDEGIVLVDTPKCDFTLEISNDIRFLDTDMDLGDSSFLYNIKKAVDGAIVVTESGYCKKIQGNKYNNYEAPDMYCEAFDVKESDEIYIRLSGINTGEDRVLTVINAEYENERFQRAEFCDVTLNNGRFSVLIPYKVSDNAVKTFLVDKETLTPFMDDIEIERSVFYES